MYIAKIRQEMIDKVATKYGSTSKVTIEFTRQCMIYPTYYVMSIYDKLMKGSQML